MANLDDAINETVAKFKNGLKFEEDKFALATLSDVYETVEEIQKKQRRLKRSQNLARLQPFLKAVTHYGQTIEVFVNTSLPPPNYIWGPMKHMLQVR
jgi:hypothetical protein